MEKLHIDYYTVASYHTDFAQQLSPVALFCFLQENAWHHVELNGFGWHHLFEKQQFWVLSKVSAVIHRMPCWTEKIRLETWGKQPELLTAFRDFEMFDENNIPLISVGSTWHILDMNTHRIVKTTDFLERFPIYSDRHTIDKKPEKIILPETEMIQGDAFAVKPSDIDMNQHVNNTRYVQWAMDEIPFDFQKTHKLAEIDVNFVKEGRIGECCCIKTYLENNVFTQAIVSQNDDRVLALVKSKWIAV
jgi:acyl-ACP thioesterase